MNILKPCDAMADIIASDTVESLLHRVELGVPSHPWHPAFVLDENPA